jgi:hypothetical protein
LGSGSVPSLCWSLVSVYSFGIIIMKHTTACIHYTIVLMKFVIRIFLYLNFLYTLGTLFVFSVPRLYEDHQVFVFSIHPSREYITFIGPKKNTCGSGSQPTLLFFQRDWLCDPIFSGLLWAAHTACQNGICCHTNYWTKLPKFVHRKYASLVNIDVGTQLQITQQKNPPKPGEKKIFFNLFPTSDPNFFTIWNRNHRYFFRPWLYRALFSCMWH